MRILVVEDQRKMASFLKKGLTEAGYSVDVAETGGVILQWWLGYNFSVAVWVGYIALYGVAVQTGVVMVVYLHEALDKRLRRGDDLTPDDILRATIDGSVLRLRPKLMTVTVVMAMRIVGVLLIAALMVLPVATSRLLARSFRATLIGAVGVGVVSAVLGLFAARQWALAAGGAIVLVAAALFALASIIAGARRAGAQADSLLAGPH
jgi:hypothetical protein